MSGLAYDVPESDTDNLGLSLAGGSSTHVYSHSGGPHPNNHPNWAPATYAYDAGGPANDFYQPPRAYPNLRSTCPFDGSLLQRPPSCAILIIPSLLCLRGAPRSMTPHPTAFPLYRPSTMIRRPLLIV